MHPFETQAELDRLAAEVGPRYGPMILFAAATGLRPGEWIALEHRDIDRGNRPVHVRRAFRVNRLKTTKTDTPRVVPLQRSALDALDQLPSPPSATSLLFPAPEGGYLDLHNWRPRRWRPAQRAADIAGLSGRALCRTRTGDPFLTMAGRRESAMGAKAPAQEAQTVARRRAQHSAPFGTLRYPLGTPAPRTAPAPGQSSLGTPFLSDHGPEWRVCGAYASGAAR
jgi:integrase